jgi:small GTP-binding protein
MTVIQKKVCLLGDFSVGKTSLVRRFVEGRFEDKYLSTIGVRISRKTLQRPTGTLNLLVWDLAGAQEFNTQSSYLVGVTAALIVCDLTRHETFLSYMKYVQQVRAVNPIAPLMFVGNKVDLVDERAITDDELSEYSQNLGSRYVLTSAKTDTGVEYAFTRLADELEARL